MSVKAIQDFRKSPVGEMLSAELDAANKRDKRTQNGINKSLKLMPYSERRMRWRNALITNDKFRAGVRVAQVNKAHDVSAATRYGGRHLTPLMRACATINVEEFERIAAGTPLTPEIVNETCTYMRKSVFDFYKFNCLHMVCYAASNRSQLSATPWNWRPIVLALLKAGVDVNAICGSGRDDTALTLAIRAGNPALCALLLDYGANIVPGTYLLDMFMYTTTGMFLKGLREVFEVVVRRLGTPGPNTDNFNIYAPNPWNLVPRPLETSLGQFRTDTIVLYGVVCNRAVMSAFQHYSRHGQFESTLVDLVLAFLLDTRAPSPMFRVR